MIQQNIKLGSDLEKTFENFSFPFCYKNDNRISDYKRHLVFKYLSLSLMPLQRDRIPRLIKQSLFNRQLNSYHENYQIRI